MKGEELTEVFMMISNWKNPFVSMVYTKNLRAAGVKERTRKKEGNVGMQHMGAVPGSMEDK